MVGSAGLGPIGQFSRQVRDLGAAVTWYRDVLGLTHLFTFGTLAFFDCHGIRLFLSEGDKEVGEPGDSILYFRTDDSEEAHRQLTERGVTFRGRASHDPSSRVGRRGVDGVLRRYRRQASRVCRALLRGERRRRAGRSFMASASIGACGEPQSAAFEGRYRVIRYDLRGHGDSVAYGEPYTGPDDLRMSLILWRSVARRLLGFRQDRSWPSILR